MTIRETLQAICDRISGQHEDSTGQRMGKIRMALIEQARELLASESPMTPTCETCQSPMRVYCAACQGRKAGAVKSDRKAKSSARNGRRSAKAQRVARRAAR